MLVNFLFEIKFFLVSEGKKKLQEDMNKISQNIQDEIKELLFAKE